MNMTAKVHELKKMKLAKADLEKEITEIEDFIKGHMEEQGVDEMMVDVFKIRWAAHSTTRLDTKALKAELPDIATRYSKTTQVKRLSIT